jgi:hypothetical protein
MTSEQIHAAIRAAYPDADPLRDYTVRDDGSGPYLAQWNIAGPVPEGVPMTTPTEPAVLRWQRLSLEQIARGAALVDGLAPSHRLGPAVQSAIDAAAPGEVVEGGSWTKEEAAEVMQLWTALEAFLATPLGEGGPTPLEIITRYA